MKEVFEVYPEVDKIYVVDGMPFLAETPAINHSKAVGKPVETVLRTDAATPKGVDLPPADPELIETTEPSPEAQDSGKPPKRKK